MCVIAGMDRDKRREEKIHPSTKPYLSHSAISDKIYSRYVFKTANLQDTNHINGYFSAHVYFEGKEKNI